MFHIPAYFIELICFAMVIVGIILTVSGIYLAVHETKGSKEHPPLRKIKILKFSLEISRPTLIIIIGLVVTISPLILQYYAKDVRADDIGLFKVINDKRTYDFSEHFFVENEKQISKVKQVRDIRLIKNIPTDEIRYRYSTTGKNVIPTCTSHPTKTLTLGSQDKSTISTILKLRIEKEVIIDISKEETGELFSIRCNAVFENAFQGKTKEWAGGITKHKTEKLTMVLAFNDKNKDRAFYRKMIKEGGSEKIDIPDIGTLKKSGQQASWEITNPTLFKTYILVWSWE